MKQQKAAWILVVAFLVCAPGAVAQTGQQAGTSGLKFAKYPGIHCSAALECPAAESRDAGRGDAAERRRRR